MRGASWAALVLSLGAVPGCTVNLQKLTGGPAVTNHCATNSDCGNGTCRDGVCAAFEGMLPTLLVEVTPPTTAPGVGGIPFLQVATGLGENSDDYPIDLSRPAVVHGYVTLSNCARWSVPASVVLIPKEQTYGLPSPTYVADTVPAAIIPDKAGQCPSTPPNGVSEVQEFTLNLPAGHYDIYARPIGGSGPFDGGAALDCNFVPQVFSDVEVTSGGATQCLSLPASAAKDVTIEVLWPRDAPTLDGWTIDVVHPLTGQVISDRVTLRGPSRALPSGAKQTIAGTATPTGYSIDLRYSPLSVSDSKAGEELVRLSPPPSLVAPTVQFQLSGLQVFASTHEAIVPTFGVLTSPLRVSPRIQGQKNGASVSGTVTFDSTRLDGVDSGVFASYSATGVVGANGGVDSADGGSAAEGEPGIALLPGDYRVRVVPDIASGLAAAETTLRVSASNLAPTITVPPQASFRGVVTVSGAAPSTEGGALDGASVQAQPATIGARACEPGTDAAVCSTAPLGVLDVALAEDAFLPRPVSGIVHGGEFNLAVDCGGCTDADGAAFDLSVRPPASAALPWAVRPFVRTRNSPVSLDFAVPLPVVIRGVVQIPVTFASVASSGPQPVPNALIRAYVVRDEQGYPILDPAVIASCATVSASEAIVGVKKRCASVLQIAETRGRDDGSFELLLPPSLTQF